MTRQFTSRVAPSDVFLALTELGIEITKTDNLEAWALCPGHTATVGHLDKKPSWSVNLETGQHHCFSCGWGGSFATLVALVKKIDTSQADIWVRSNGGLEVARKKLFGSEGSAQSEPEPISEADLALFVDPPEEVLCARDVSLESCQKFGVQWNPEKSCWIFPIRDPYTRELRGWQEKSDRRFRNMPAHVKKRDTLFGLDTISGTRLIVQESPIDSVRVWSYGIDSCVSSYGVNLSSDQMRLLIEFSSEILFALDNDPAGEAMSAKLQTEYRGRVRVRYFNYGSTGAKDTGDLNAEQITWGVENATSSVVTRFKC